MSLIARYRVYKYLRPSRQIAFAFRVAFGGLFK